MNRWRGWWGGRREGSQASVGGMRCFKVVSPQRLGVTPSPSLPIPLLPSRPLKSLRVVRGARSFPFLDDFNGHYDNLPMQELDGDPSPQARPGQPPRRPTQAAPRTVVKPEFVCSSVPARDDTHCPRHWFKSRRHTNKRST
ncbi:hypothetical protein E2C01_070238 [Portunus trituberculatus]|uniref:Uncharacterized protein n=1 Tax=Portunus trituberculatus TaxID=210409 RepID=A0A5B7HS60_PORTR|nr:hypothetical protein [Portunus trituberculatus]